MRRGSNLTFELSGGEAVRLNEGLGIRAKGGCMLRVFRI